MVIWLAPPLLILLVGAFRGLAPGSGAGAWRSRRWPAWRASRSPAISLAQQSEPTSTPVGALPNPARIWTTSNPKVLKPVASENDDARRDPRTQTADGTFKARCPGKARLTVTSGFEKKSKRIVVTGDGGPACR